MSSPFPLATVLNVDDAEAARYARSRVLRRAGFEVLEASTGGEALAVVAEKRVDIVLLDIRLPDVSGFEVCRQLKENEHTYSIPVLHVTASAQDAQSQVRGLEYADAYLVEPVEPSILIATINATLRARRGEAERATVLEQLLQESQLIHLSHDAVIIRDAQDRIVKWNAGATELYQWKEPEVAGLPAHVVLKTRSAPELQRELLRSDRWEGELVHVRRDGGSVIVDSRQVVLHGANGERAAVLEINRDVTAQRRAEAALHEREQHLSMALRVAGMVAWTCDLASGRLMAEENVQDVCGVASIESPAEVLAVIHPEDREHCRTDLQQLAGEGGKRHMRFRIVRPDTGSVVWIETHAVGIPDAAGPVRKLVGISMDVTERIRSERAQEEELDRTKENLRALAADLLSAQEDERRRIARELHDDFGQRLAALQIRTDQLQADVAKNRGEHVRQLAEISGELGLLCEDSRRLSHQLHPAVVEDLGLEIALRQMLEHLERTHGLAARVTSRLSGRLLPLATAIPLYRIAQEAVRNAIRHAPGAPVHVELSEANHEIRMVVRDEGPGFAADAKRGERGLGIISMKERARLAGGTLTIRSSPRGTEVITLLPCAQSEESAVRRELTAR